MRLLVAENDSALGVSLQRGFGAEQYSVGLTQSGEHSKRMVREQGLIHTIRGVGYQLNGRSA